MRPDHRDSVVGVVDPVVGVDPVVAAEEIFERDASAGKNYLTYLKTQNSCPKKGAMGRGGKGIST
jgi:hypothetical protein